MLPSISCLWSIMTAIIRRPVNETDLEGVHATSVHHIPTVLGCVSCADRQICSNLLLQQLLYYNAFLSAAWFAAYAVRIFMKVSTTEACSARHVYMTCMHHQSLEQITCIRLASFSQQPYGM